MLTTLKLFMVGLVLGIFLFDASGAYAIMGTRIARRAIASREAKQQLAARPDSEAETKTSEDLGREQEEAVSTESPSGRRHLLR